MFAIVLSFLQELGPSRDLLKCLSTTSREIAYNANMLNILNEKTIKYPKIKAMMDISSIFTQKSFWSRSWNKP